MTSSDSATCRARRSGQPASTRRPDTDALALARGSCGRGGGRSRRLYCPQRTTRLKGSNRPMSATPDPHKPLRDDVRLLGELLGQAIRAREGDGMFAVVERVRALAKSGRSGDSSAFDTLAAELGAMPVEEVLP